MSLQQIPHIILVLSGKGGVGKSSVTTQLALTLSLQGHSVGILDVDLTGPSIPRFLGVESAKITQSAGGLLPVTVHEAKPAQPTVPTSSDNPSTTPSSNISYARLSAISLGLVLSSRSTAVIWRGPKKTAMVRQFLTSTVWPSDTEYLLIDTPPGTSDEHISLLETLLKETAATPAQLSGAVVVTTPQAVAISDVKKELDFCRKTGLRVLGVVENMAGFVCPHCSECTNVFSKGGGEIMAREAVVPFLGSVPIDPAFVALIEEGKRPVYPKGTVVGGTEAQEAEGNGEDAGTRDDGLLVEKYTSCSIYPLFEGMVNSILKDIEERDRNGGT
ncbi:cytosolic Fe-S cluster assembling factor cfd1 [Eremomyces bilateralis CBS 781.70]|uniref:Cytosolic Fe-S cluster assembling factor cfd1 n=1 Tax=Eremomyces bilateralis CBS 781.70 TaxID=1392243 RepID=A0A6G1G6P5_9PEZI|nr:cytosolic Fe-S cluster assembling factor cfd1 [Eremomyces bilateralis CBS 781.70]KAF1813737.1 cytosolic Fe-S cluster assembling factor cfd1 [Eremomyces bilateralis CBS 781.70]